MVDVAVLGCGPWGRNIIRTLLDLESTEDFRLREIVHQGSTERAETVNEAFNFECHTDLTEALNRNDAICVATPDETHFELVETALQSGLDVFVEKPLCFNRTRAEELFSLATKNNCLLMPGHLMLYHPLLSALQEEPNFQPGTLDEIVINRLSRLRDNGERRLLHSSLIHDLTVLDALYGATPSLTSCIPLGPYPPGRSVSGTLLYKETKVQIRARSDWPFPERTITFRRGEQFFHFDGQSDELTLSDQADPTEDDRLITFDELPLTAELKNFIRSSQELESCRVSKQHVLRVMKTLESIQQRVLNELQDQ
ncbi:MAG: Gfo/Idh/MocA family protein [bacterium]